MATDSSTAPQRALAWLTGLTCALVLVGGVTSVAYRLGAREAGLTPVAEAAAGEANTEEDLQPLARLYEQLVSDAVEVPAGGALVEGAAQGMVDSLGDPYADYFDADEYSEFNQFLEGTFSGVGMLLEETPEGLIVVTVFEDTPAKRAGVQEGERIVSVDGEDVRDTPIERVVNLIKGGAGTEVTLGLSGGDAGQRELTMVRREIELPTFTSRMLDDRTGYVMLLQFSDRAGEDVEEAVDDLLADGASGIILDLRNNPGGLLDEAIDVASVFLDEGTEVVSVQERAGQTETYEATGGAVDAPLVVLVDGGSASASEIVAGAVQDGDRGTLVGQTTFGKGTVQTIRSLPDGGGVKFTTARYYTPSGDSIEGVGVQPAVVVEGDDEQLRAARQEVRSLVAAGEG